MVVKKSRLPVSIFKLPIAVCCIILFYGIIEGPNFYFPAMLASLNASMGVNNVTDERLPFAQKRIYGSLIGFVCGGLYVLFMWWFGDLGEINLLLLLVVSFLAMMLCKRFSDKTSIIGATLTISLLVLVDMKGPDVWHDLVAKIAAILIGNVIAFFINTIFDYFGWVDAKKGKIAELTNHEKWIRIVKLLIVMLLCFAGSMVLNQFSKPFLLLISLSTGIIGTNPNTKVTWTFGIHRMAGTLLGCGFGLLFLKYNFVIENPIISSLIFLPILILMIGLLSCLSPRQGTVLASATACLLILSLVIDPDGGWDYAYRRLAATLLGALAALIGNVTIHFIIKHFLPKGSSRRT